MDQFQMLLEQLKALADETRLKIFKLVADRELCVCQIVPAIGLSQPTVSVHLAKLRRAGLVKERKAAQWSHYSGDEEGIARFRQALDAFLSASPAEIPSLRTIAESIPPQKEGANSCRL